MTVAILGHGNVGGALARGFAKAGMRVVIAQDPARGSLLPDWVKEYGCEAMDPEGACEASDALVLAVPFGALAEAVTPLKDALKGKVVVDCTNPVGPDLSHGLNSTQSGSEFLQSLLPECNIAKCFTIYGYENFESAPKTSPKPSMLICGDSASAKTVASQLAAATGWDPVDVGALNQALHLEHLTLLWIKWVRLGGASPHTVWARLTG